MAEAHSNLEGLCRISQGFSYLTEYNGHAVTTLAEMTANEWRLTYHQGSCGAGSRYLTIALTNLLPGGADDVVKVLTLGKKTEEDGIQIFLQPLQNPPPKSQLWTLEHIIATKRNPPLVHAHIQSVEYPEMSAGVGILNSPLPKMYLNVAAGPNGQLQDDQKWKLDFILPQRADLDNN